MTFFLVPDCFAPMLNPLLLPEVSADPVEDGAIPFTAWVTLPEFPNDPAADPNGPEPAEKLPLKGAALLLDNADCDVKAGVVEEDIELEKLFDVREDANGFIIDAAGAPTLANEDEPNIPEEVFVDAVNCVEIVDCALTGTFTLKGAVNDV